MAQIDSAKVVLVLTLGPNQVIDDRTDILFIDRRLVGSDHLVHFGLPGSLRQRRLVQHHLGGMAGKTVVVDGVRAWTRKQAVTGREIDRYRLERDLVLN